MENRNYYLGLDIGTDSVGYAVTDEQYNILKYRGEPAWGVHLFDEAKLKAERRAFRTARRRLDRRQQRVQLVQELFAQEIAKIDPRFYIRLQESALFPEDKLEKNSLFNDPNFTDKEFHHRFPTIHHLICALMEPEGEYDVRLVYLACARLVAHRGHFLNEIDRNNIGRITDFADVYDEFRHSLTDKDHVVPWDGCDIKGFADAISMKGTVTSKYKKLSSVCFENGKVPKNAMEDFPYNCEVLLKCLCGSTVKAKDLFLNDEYAEIRSFSLGSDDETMAEVLSALGDDAQLIEKAKAVYDWGLLTEIIRGKSCISEAKVAEYNKHREDLQLLKYFVRKYKPELYSTVFREPGTANYSAYAFHGDTSEIKRKADQASFCDYLKKSVIKGIIPDDGDAEAFNSMKESIELGSFMPKQKNTDNRVIPQQLYWYELDRILKNAERYLPFLLNKDDDGLTISDKVRSVFEFRVPYYVGPLNNKSSHSWIVRKQGRILPWNFDRLVDRDACEQEFIRRMAGSCTYLPSEKALPKDSLLYHKFMVLNEINNLRINDRPITVEQKQAIYNNVFLAWRKVTVKRIADHLISIGAMSRNDRLTGIDTAVKSDMKPYHDFKRLLTAGVLNEAQVEEIIERRTYCEDASRFRHWLEQNYAFLSKDDLNYVARLTYKDFGRLSARFLTGIYAVTDHTTGEMHSIIETMWETNLNHNEVLSDKFTFGEQIKREAEEYYAENASTADRQLDDMYISSAVKRPILRTLEIVQEVTKAFNVKPAKIFIEMARGGKPDQKGKRTLSRKEQLLALYAQCADEDVRLLKQQLEAMGESADSRLQSDKLFLYYVQLGRCMYTGRAIDLEKLMHGDTGTYNIEHIYPQSLVKDDSILNNEVLVESVMNGAKSDTYPVDISIRMNMRPYWEKLRAQNLITDEKFSRLTRGTAFTADEKWGFINRQLTETTQATKAIAVLLKKQCPDTEIVYVKARLASEFRQEFDCVKSRIYNDLHHAKDAYLNIVAGNVYNMRFTRRWFSVEDAYSVKTKALYTHPVICGGVTVWDGTSMLEKVKHNLQKNNIHMTRYAFMKTGGFFDQMPVKAAAGLIPRKKDLPTEKYGGYNKPSVAFFLPVRYRIGKKTDIMIVPVELMAKDIVLKGNTEQIETYVKTRIGSIVGKKVDTVEFPVGRRVLKVNSVLSLDGFKIFISGTAGGALKLITITFTPFIANAATERYIKRLEMFKEKNDKNPNYVYDPDYDKITAEQNAALYDLYERKLEHSIYRNRPTNPIGDIKKGKAVFRELTIVDQAAVLLNIHAFFGRLSGGSDLTKIKGTAHSGYSTISVNISNWKKNWHEVRIVDQSASGLWETQSENLLDLL